jgi:hypothetical protein
MGKKREGLGKKREGMGGKRFLTTKHTKYAKGGGGGGRILGGWPTEYTEYTEGRRGRKRKNGVADGAGGGEDGFLEER